MIFFWYKNKREMNYDYTFKYILVGDSSTGKSSLLSQFVHSTFPNEHDITIGVEFGTKTLDIQGKRIKLQIWDTAGQEVFRSITQNYYRNSAVAICVYDITSRRSFYNIPRWVEDIQKVNDNVKIILVGNKSDSSRREVQTEEARKFALENNLTFYEVSAKTRKNILNIFVTPTEEIITKINTGELNPLNKLPGIIPFPTLPQSLNPPSSSQYTDCCTIS